MARAPPAKFARLLRDQISTIFHAGDAGLAADSIASDRSNAAFIARPPPTNLLIPIDSPENGKDLRRSGHGSCCYSYDTDQATRPCATSGRSSEVVPGRVGGFLFTENQLRELQTQALVFRYIVCGASVPVDLVLSVKASLFSSIPSPPCTHFDAGWKNRAAATRGEGGGALPLEEGRCRRTDGKKWRCARDVVPYHKYCERHIHRGRHHNQQGRPSRLLTSKYTPAASASPPAPPAHRLRLSTCVASTPTSTIADRTAPVESESAELLRQNDGMQQQQAEHQEQLLIEQPMATIHNFGICTSSNKRPPPSLRQFFDESPSAVAANRNDSDDGSNSCTRTNDGSLRKSGPGSSVADRDVVDQRRSLTETWAWTDDKEAEEGRRKYSHDGMEQCWARSQWGSTTSTSTTTTELCIWSAAGTTTTSQAQGFPFENVCKSLLQEPIATTKRSGWGRCLDLRSPTLKLTTASPTHI